MIKKYFKLKNKRTYIHGTDIFNYFINGKKYKYIDIRFKKILKSQPKVILMPSNTKKIVASISFLQNKRKKKIYLQETNLKVLDKYVIEENIPSSNYEIKKTTAKCDFTTSLTPIEVLVDLTKKFHNEAVSKKKWLFTKIFLIKNFKRIKRKKFKILIIQNYQNLSTVCKIFEYNKHLGFINFSTNKSL